MKNVQKDYYADLGVSSTATQAEIRSVWRKLAIKTHPDRNANDSNAEARFKIYSEAYNVIGDAEKRKAYDDAKAYAAANDPLREDFWERATSSRPPPPPRASYTPPPPPPPPKSSAQLDRPEFDNKLRMFNAVNVQPQMRETLASELCAALRKYPQWKSEQAVHKTIIDNSAGFSSTATQTLFSEMITNNPQGARYHFDKQLKKLDEPYVKAYVREAAAAELATLLKAYLEWKTEPRIYETVIANAAGFASPAMKNLFDATIADNPAAEKHQFDAQFKKFSSPNSILKVKVFLASELGESLAKHPEWVDANVAKVVDAVNDQAPGNAPLQNLQKTVQTILAARTNTGSSQKSAPVQPRLSGGM